MKTAPIHNARDNFAHIVLAPGVRRDDAVYLLRFVKRWLGVEYLQLGLRRSAKIFHYVPNDGQCVFIVQSGVVGNARQLGVHISASQGFGVNDFPRGRPY